MSTPDSNVNPFIKALGFAMIAMGVVIALYLVKEILSIYTDFDSSTFLSMMREKLNGAVMFKIENASNITIGEGGTAMMAMSFLLLLAWSGASISYAFIRCGTQLLSFDIKANIESLKQKLSKIMEDVKQK